jgi:hypothetical protein
MRLLKQLIRNYGMIKSCFKIGISNFIGGITRIILGAINSEDVSYRRSFKEQTDFLRVSKEHITVVKPSFNSCCSLWSIRHP